MVNQLNTFGSQRRCLYSNTFNFKMNSSIAKEPTQRLSAKELIEILEVKKNTF
jgi:hypothetical protein